MTRVADAKISQPLSLEAVSRRLSLSRVINLYQTSLAAQTLVNISLRIAFVVLISTTVSYFHVMHNLKDQTVQQLERYIVERGQRESTIFQLAEDNLTSLRDQFLQQSSRFSNPESLGQFAQNFFPWSDGTTRNFPQSLPLSEFDSVQQASTFVNRETELTPSLQRRLLLAQNLITSHGMAWSNRFLNTYLNTAQNTTTIYWKGTPLALQADADFKPTQDEYFYVADPQHAPERQPVWTGVYADTVTKVWMMSAVVPLYEGEQFIGGLGHDIELNDLIAQTIDDNLPGAYNIIFSRDGRLIAHPHYIQQIQDAQGHLNINDVNDGQLQRIFQMSLSESQGVIESRQDREFLAVTQLTGPDWLFVTVYPEALLSEAAFDTIKFVLIAGLLALSLEVVLLLIVLRNRIALPLQYLTTASQSLTEGNFEVDLELNRQDELGQLASSFTQMTKQLQNSFQELNQKVIEKEQAERLVLEKNEALEQALRQLQDMQLTTVQNEKMATLGNLVAGVAHEINNPIGFLSGSIRNAKDYVQDLVDYLATYHAQQPPDEVVQETAAEIDLDFLLQDLPKLLNSMTEATHRIRGISRSLRTFSRSDTENRVSANLHEGLDSALLILKYRLKANPDRPAIGVSKVYGDLPEVSCFPGQLNQVFMNILANAIDVFDEMAQETTFKVLQDNPQTITIRTAVLRDKNAVEIRIADNGRGMLEAVRTRIFDHLFTTKDVGKGTGLGLAISRQIVVETHGGTLDVQSDAGKGSEFCICLPLS